MLGSASMDGSVVDLLFFLQMRMVASTSHLDVFYSCALFLMDQARSLYVEGIASSISFHLSPKEILKLFHYKTIMYKRTSREHL